MKSIRMMPLTAVLAVVLLGITSAGASDDSFKSPDSLVLKDGRVINGLILKNTFDAVLIQEKFGEHSYPKSQIVRIRDNANVKVEFTDIYRHGSLPSWRVIANDLRSHDSIKSMVEIPAVVIDNGILKNIPYMSFRVNRDIELNIYGDPENPAALELGIYGSKSGDKKVQQDLRGYLAGYLTTRKEIAALYSLPFSGGIKDADELTIEITPKDAPDAYGGWWISLYNKKELAKVALDDAEYAKLVRPPSEVVDAKGNLIGNRWTADQMDLNKRMDDIGNAAKVMLRGFYRDDTGTFRLITDKPAQ